MATQLRAAIPAHVPADRVREFDVYNVAPGARDMMASAQQAIGTFPRICYTPLNGGHWIITGYEEAARCGRETASFSNRPYTIPNFADETALIPLLLDPPEHTDWRGVFNKLFTPKMAVLLKDAVRESAGRLIDAVKDDGACDLVRSFSELLPVSVFLELMGLPVERLKEYRDAVKTYLGDPDLNAKRRIAEWIIGELNAAITEREAESRGDLISAFIRSTVNGRPVTRDEVVNMSMMIFTAGLDTVTVSLSYGIRCLAEDQALQARVRADPKLVPDLMEEMLRRFSAAQPGRTVVSDVEMDGVRLKQGDRVFVMLAAANLDDAVFEAPTEVRLDRPKTPHLAFNVGPHRCVGMHLARVELQVAYEEWLARIPQFRVDDRVKQEAGGGHVFSISNLPLRWD